MENLSAMNENFNMLRQRLLDFVDNFDLQQARAAMTINEPTLIVGSGGSFVSCQFLQRVLEALNPETIFQAKRPEQVLNMNLRPYKRIIDISFSGKNHGNDVALEYAKKFGILPLHFSASKKDEPGIYYGHKLESEDSFISLAGTLGPMVIALAVYLDDKELTKNIIDKMFKTISKQTFEVSDAKSFEIVGIDRFPTACAFFESALSESSIGIPVVSSSYDMCHGRTTSLLQQKADRQLLYLYGSSGETELDEMLHKRLEKLGVGEQLTDIHPVFQDEILDDLYMTLYVACWCRELAEKKGVDLSTMKDASGKRLFLGADESAVEAWEAEHKKDFFAGRPHWDELTAFDGENYPYNIGAPAKFSNASLSPNQKEK